MRAAPPIWERRRTPKPPRPIHKHGAASRRSHHTVRSACFGSPDLMASSAQACWLARNASPPVFHLQSAFRYLPTRDRRVAHVAPAAPTADPASRGQPVGKLDFCATNLQPLPDDAARLLAEADIARRDGPRSGQRKSCDPAAWHRRQLPFDGIRECGKAGRANHLMSALASRTRPAFDAGASRNVLPWVAEASLCPITGLNARQVELKTLRRYGGLVEDRLADFREVPLRI